MIPHDSLCGRDLVDGKFNVMEFDIGNASLRQERESLEDGEIRTSGTSKWIATGAKIPNASTNFPGSNFPRQGGLHERILIGL
jgi:hypothetical protein